MSAEPLMTSQEVCKYLGVHEMTVYRWTKARVLPGAKVGGRWRYRRQDIENMLNKLMEVRRP